MFSHPHLPPLRRRDLPSLQSTPLHVARNWSKADVSLVEWPRESGRKWVLKDFGQRPLWFRMLIGRRALRREWRALRRLHHVENVPCAHLRIDADAILMDYCPGKQIVDIKRNMLPVAVIKEMEELIQTIHEKGVAHGDLHANNILINDDGSGFTLIDWATAWYFGKNPRWLRKVLFKELRALDDRALAKIKVEFHPQALNDTQRNILLNGGSMFYRTFKNIRHFIERLRGKDTSAKRARKLKIYQERIEQSKQDSDESKNEFSQ